MEGEADHNTKPMNETNESGLKESEYWAAIEEMAGNAIARVKENDVDVYGGAEWFEYVWEEVENSDLRTREEHHERVLEYTNAEIQDENTEQAVRESVEEDVISKMRMMH